MENGRFMGWSRVEWLMSWDDFWIHAICPNGASRLPLIARATAAQLPSFSKLHQLHYPPVAKDGIDAVGHSKGHIGCL
jgi:hypothetical protein